MLTRIILAIYFAVFTSSALFSQTVGSQPGPMTICPPGPFAGHFYTPVSEAVANKILMKDGTEPCATIEVTYNGFTPAAEAAFQAAVDIWSYSISSPVTIRVNATWEPLDEGVLGSAGPTNVFNNFANAPDANYYASALADEIAGTDLDPGQPDIAASFSSVFDWYLGTDGNTPNDQYDLVSVVLHELGHGLGFISSANYNESTGNGTYGLGGSSIPLRYDPFMILGQNGQPMLNLAEGFVLGNAFTSNNVYCNSDSASFTNGSVHPKLYAPEEYNVGSSLSHWDESYFPAGNVHSLMTPQIGAGEVIHTPGPATLGLFKDMGWEICGGSSAPLCATESLVVTGETAICPEESTTVALTNPAQIPEGGGYAINFYNPTIDDGLFLYGITVPYTFDNDLNGVLSTNGYDLFEGEYEVTGHVYTDPEDPTGSICASSAEVVSVTFYSADDSECATTIDCATETLVVTGETAICPEETTSVALTNAAQIPDGGGYGINFYNPAIDDGIFIYGITLPYTFDNDLNGVLSDNGFDLFEGEYELTGQVYTDPEDASGSICASSAEAVLVTFYSADDAECSTVVDCATETLVITGETAICPEETTTATLTNAAQIPEGGGYGINFYNPAIDDGIFIYGITLPYTFDDDLNGTLSANGFDLFEGEYELTGHVYTDPDDASGTICASSAEAVLVTFYTADDAECTVIECSAGTISSPDGLEVCPEQFLTIPQNGTVEFGENGGYRLKVVTTDNTYYLETDVPENSFVVNNDLFGVVSDLGDDPIVGVTTIQAQTFLDSNNPDNTICNESNVMTIDFLTEDDAECITAVEKIGVDFDWVIYPNPVNTLVSIKLNDSFSGNCELKLRDLSGRVVRQKLFAGLHKGSVIEVPVEKLAQGFYSISLENEKGRFVKNIVVN